MLTHSSYCVCCNSDPKPVVECSFVTEFEDHIFVAMDAEVLLFLHDLVMSYIREKDKGQEIVISLKLLHPYTCTMTGQKDLIGVEKKWMV